MSQLLASINAITLEDLLPADLMAELRAVGRLKRYADGHMIQQRGDSRPGMSIVESGQVLAGNVGVDGVFLTTSLLNRGQCYGEFTLFAGLPRTHDLWAAGPTEITHIRGRDFIAMFEREPVIAKALLTITLRRNHELLEFLDAQQRLPLPVRVARLLLTAVDVPSTSTLVVECRQEDLAFLLGISRVSIGKALKKLREQKLVELEYGRIVLPDVDQLTSWVDAAYSMAPVNSAATGR